MHLNQVYLLCLPSEDLKATRRTVKMTALQAIGAGAVDERKMPSLRTGKSLFQRMKEKIDAEKARKGTSGGILNKRQRRAKRIAEMAERKRLEDG